MSCYKCGGELTERASTSGAPYHYTSSGLDNVFLVNVILRRCKSCGTESVVIPKMAELHQKIVKWLLENPGRLRGRELRFLRKHAGISSTDFASQLQVEPETLSRIENEKQELGVPTEKLGRAIIKAELEASDRDLRDFLRRKERLRETRERGSIFEFKHPRWKIQAA